MTEQLTMFTYPEAIRHVKIRNRIMEDLEKLSTQLIATLKKDAYYMHSPKDAADLLIHIMSPLDQEQLRVMTLNTKNRVMNLHLIYKGSLNQSAVRIGEVYRPAIIENAAAIIVAHNHPSGDALPSPDDIAVTRAIVEAGKLLDIDCLDHLVIAGGTFTSLKERGLGFTVSETRAPYQMNLEHHPIIEDNQINFDEYNALDDLRSSILYYLRMYPDSPLNNNLTALLPFVDVAIDALFDYAISESLD
jgi:hypothetical protein